MFLLNQIFKFLRLLHSETATGQLSGGFVLGMFMGFTPVKTLHWATYFLLLLILRVNMGAAFIAYGVFGLLSFALDPLFHQVGLSMLGLPSLRALWTTLYNAPIVPYTYFYNSIVMGSFVIALAASVPLFILANVLIAKYRLVVVARFKVTYLWKAWTASKLYPLYAKYQQFKE